MLINLLPKIIVFVSFRRVGLFCNNEFEMNPRKRLEADVLYNCSRLFMNILPEYVKSKVLCETMNDLNSSKIMFYLGNATSNISQYI